MGYPSAYASAQLSVDNIGFTPRQALAGDVEGARKIIPRLNQLIPDVRVSSLKVLLNPYRPEDVEKVIEGLRKVGLPE